MTNDLDELYQQYQMVAGKGGISGRRYNGPAGEPEGGSAQERVLETTLQK